MVKYLWMHRKGAVLLFVIASVLLAGIWLPIFIISLETIKISPLTSAYVQTPMTEHNLSWAEDTGNTASLSSVVFQGENKFLTGACFPTEPDMNFISGGEQSGFRELYHRTYPERNLFRSVGFNFEHIISGRLEDEFRNSFAPRKEPAILRQLTEDSVSIFWPSKTSSWGIASKMTCTFGSGPYLDMTFNTVLKDPLERDYLIYMWANYMNNARNHHIYFFGVRDTYQFPYGYYKGDIGWVRFGERKMAGGVNESSAIPFLGSTTLDYEKIKAPYNIELYTRCFFLLPFFYGLMDGDGDLTTPDDTMVYLMMFDQAEPIRFIFFDSGKSNMPVWDWQYVVCNPQINQPYQYRARLVYKDYQGVKDITDEYVNWVKDLGRPLHEVTFAVEPEESGTIFPENLDGAYGHDARIYFGVNPAVGWIFDHWEGPVNDPKRRYSGMQVKQSSQVRAVCKPAGLMTCRGL